MSTSCNSAREAVPESKSLALVPYVEESISPLKRSKRTFVYGDIELQISQQWDNLGVSAVVWEAVNLIALFHDINYIHFQAEILNTFLYENVDFIINKEIIELGAGTGLCSLLSAVLGK